MKLNWGHGIAIFFSVFVISLIYQVYRSTQYDNSLVSEKYYADDLNYQQHYNKLVNTQQLEEDLQIHTNRKDNTVELRFPDEVQQVHGEIYFFCPSDQKSDFKIAIAPQDKTQKVSMDGLRPGLWRIKVNWDAEGKEYYKETTINIGS
jgi:nitrogen fixation protein FixH